MQQCPDRPVAPEEKFIEYVVGALVKQFSARLEAKLDEAISESVESMIHKVTLERVEARVLEVLAEGFPTFDGYGRELGKKTLKDKVIDVLKKPNEYGHEDAFQRTVRDCTQRLVEKMASEEVAAAREKFRGQVDTLLQAKFSETLRNALGLK